MPRKTRREIVGDGEDADRTDREKRLDKLEAELHEAWANRDEAEVEAEVTEDDEVDESAEDEPIDKDDK